MAEAMSFSITIGISSVMAEAMSFSITIGISSVMAEAMSLCSVLLPLLLILHVTCANGVYSLGEKQILWINKFQWKRQSNIPSFFSQSRRENGATILEMKERDYFSQPISNWNTRLQKCLISDDIRVRSLQHQFRNPVSHHTEDLFQSQIPLTSGIKFKTLNYIATIKLGGRNITVIVDTGSDLTWVQCQPCRSCYNQPEPLFNPSKSPSYQSILCNSSRCWSLQVATGNSGICGSDRQTCNYVVRYGGGSYTSGELGCDRLVFGAISLNKFVFGCGRKNKGLFGGASGLMGLGRSNLSLVSQTYDMFGGSFSYCLPSTETDGLGSLILGGDSSIYNNSTPISYTKMVQNPRLPTFYFLNLTGITIGGVELQATGFSKGGMMIDSGTVITWLPPSIYRALKTEFLKQFSGFPQASGFSMLNTCFDLSGYQEVNITTIRMRFEGNAELIVDLTGIFYFIKTDASQVCLALASLTSDDEIGIIGNYQQRNTRVVYDTKESKLGFAKETCSFFYKT